MTVLSGFLDHIGRLVHPDARAVPTERARHRTFLITRLGLFTGGLGAWFLALVAGHVPAPWEAMAVAWLTVPLLAAVHVARTGRLAAGETACLAAWCGLALTTTAGGGASLVGGCVMLLVVPLEATFSGRSRLVNGAVVAACLGMAALVLAHWLGLLAGHADAPVGDAVVALPALLFVVVLARASLALQRRRQQLVVLGEERFRVLAETIGDLVLRSDRAGAITMASRDAEGLFGIPPRELTGRGFFERVNVADRPAFLKLVADAGSTECHQSARLRFRTARTQGAGGPLEQPVFAWIDVRARRLCAPGTAAGTDEGIVLLVRDISRQVEHETLMEQARRAAEQANAWKDTFLANVSHELRTPLNAIIGFSEMLASPELQPRDADKQREYARIITDSGQHLLGVVNSLLDISKIEAGRFDLDPEPFAIRALVESCCEMVGLKASQGRVAIRREVAPGLAEIVADKRACKQIVINLLSNAVKFTPKGGSVTVSARADGAFLAIAVADTGVGIGTADLGRLGDAFFQARSGLDREHEGAGIGLSVVRGLVGLHGGTIAIESAPGEGTRVTVRLPNDCRTVAAGPMAKIETISRYRAVSEPGVPAASRKVSHVA